MTLETSKLIECKNNWIIVDILDNIDDLNELLEEVDPEDYSEFTTAMNGSCQKYFFNPPSRWKPNYQLKIPKIWSKVKTNYESIVENYLKHHKKFSTTSNKLSISSAWTVTGYEGSYHTPHEHGLNSISVVVYAKTLDYESPIDNGPIYFILNCDEYDLIYNPFQRIPRFIPEEKMILIFPSWTVHGTLPQSAGERTTISFDLNYQ